MFGVDAYSFEVLVPSVIGVIAMAATMTWGFIKVRHLMNEDQNEHKHS